MNDFRSVGPPVSISIQIGILHQGEKYEYDPKEDITAYELALIVPIFTALALSQKHGVPPGIEHKNWQIIQRHFRKK